MSPWTNAETGTGYYIPGIVGSVIMLFAFMQAIRFYRPRYPKVLGILLLIYSAVMAMYPIAYGKEKKITVKPILKPSNDLQTRFEFNPMTVVIVPHNRMTVRQEFEIIPNQAQTSTGIFQYFHPVDIVVEEMVKVSGMSKNTNIFSQKLPCRCKGVGFISQKRYQCCRSPQNALFS